MCSTGIGLGDLLGQAIQVGLGLGIPFVLGEISFANRRKPEQSSCRHDHFASVPRIVFEDAGVVEALEPRDLRQLPVVETAPQFHQDSSVRDAEKSGLRIVLAQGVDDAVNGGVYGLPALFKLVKALVLIARTGRHNEE